MGHLREYHERVVKRRRALIQLSDFMIPMPPDGIADGIFAPKFLQNFHGGDILAILIMPGRLHKGPLRRLEQRDL